MDPPPPNTSGPSLAELHKCKQCSFSSPLEKDVVKHLKRVHKVFQEFACNQCDYKTYRLEAHQKIHSNFKEFKCDQCPYDARHSNQLRRHVSAVHAKTKAFKCDECPYETGIKYSLKNHIQKAHMDKESLAFMCDQCTYSCHSETSLEQHISRKHISSRVFSCDQCNYTSIRRSDMQTHKRRVHCEKMDSKIKSVGSNDSSTDLKGQHPKVFPCDQCNYSTSFSSYLKQHVRTVHCKEDGFACTMCTFKTKTSKYLEKHIKGVHFKIRDHKCDRCSFATGQKKTLMNHIRMIHETIIKEFKCDECSFQASTPKCLASHKTTVYNIDKDINRGKRKSISLDDHVAVDEMSIKEEEIIKEDDFQYDTESMLTEAEEDEANYDVFTNQDYSDQEGESIMTFFTEVKEAEEDEAETNFEVGDIQEDKDLFTLDVKEECKKFTIDNNKNSEKVETKQIANNSNKVNMSLQTSPEIIITEASPAALPAKSIMNLKSSKAKSKSNAHKEYDFTKGHSGAREESPQNESNMVPLESNPAALTSSEWHKCNKCQNFSSPVEKDVIMHLKRVHKVFQEFTCNQCDYKTYKRYRLKAHQRVHSNFKEFKCDQCPYESRFPGQLKRHVSAVHVKTKAFKCDQCPYETGIKYSLKGHIQKAHSDKESSAFMCDQCPYSSSSETALEQHITRMHHSSRVFSCDQCKYASVRRDEVRAHKERVHAETVDLPLKCTECQFEASNRIMLIGHMKTEHDSTLSCDKCSYTCEKNNELVLHYRTDHEVDSLGFGCHQCQFVTTLEIYLKRHMRSAHRTDKTLACTLCSYKAKEQHNLDKHIKIVHDKVKDYKCDKCRYVSASHYQLMDHVRVVHDKIRAYKCDECSYEAGRKEHLATHKDTIHGLGLRSRSKKIKVSKKTKGKKKRVKGSKEVTATNDSEASSFNAYEMADNNSFKEEDFEAAPRVMLPNVKEEEYASDEANYEEQESFQDISVNNLDEQSKSITANHETNYKTKTTAAAEGQDSGNCKAKYISQSSTKEKKESSRNLKCERQNATTSVCVEFDFTIGGGGPLPWTY